MKNQVSRIPVSKFKRNSKTTLESKRCQSSKRRKDVNGNFDQENIKIPSLRLNSSATTLETNSENKFTQNDLKKCNSIITSEAKTTKYSKNDIQINDSQQLLKDKLKPDTVKCKLTESPLLNTERRKLLEFKDQEIKNLKTHCITLNKNLESKSNENKTLIKKINELKDEIDTLSNKYQEYKEATKELNSNKELLEKNEKLIKELQKLNDITKREFIDLRQKYDKLKEAFNELRKSKKSKSIIEEFHITYYNDSAIKLHKQVKQAGNEQLKTKKKPDKKFNL